MSYGGGYGGGGRDGGRGYSNGYEHSNGGYGSYSNSTSRYESYGYDDTSHPLYPGKASQSWLQDTLHLLFSFSRFYAQF